MDPNPYAAPSAPLLEDTVVRAPGADVLGNLLLGLPVVGGLGIGILAGTGHADLNLVPTAATLLGSIVLLLMDAGRWRIRGPRWALGFFCLMLIAYPLYFRERAKRGAPPRLALAIASMLSFHLGGTVLALLLGYKP